MAANTQLARVNPVQASSDRHGLSDEIVASIYRAAAGTEPWTQPLQLIAAAFDLWVVQFFAVNKQLGTVLFSFEGGRSRPEAAFDWFHKYHRIDPRVALVTSAGVGEWIACDEHFDEKYVARSPFYQEFLIPYGGRYVYGAKLVEDESQFVVLAFLRGSGSQQLSFPERQAVQRLAWHFTEAFELQTQIGTMNKERALGLAVLDRMRQPVIVVDANRRIIFANGSGKRLMAKCDVLSDQGGYAACRDAVSDLDLMYGLRELVLAQPAPTAEDRSFERRGLRLRKANGEQVAATLLALRPGSVLGAFGDAPMAMLAIYEPGSGSSLDPFMLETTFDLTPAESRVAARICSGLSIKQIAKDVNVSPLTVRSQMKSIFLKTGTHRQADLVRVLLLASEL